MSGSRHIDDETLDSWLRGAAGPAHAASVEQHLIACALCRDRTATVEVDDLDVEAIWFGIAERTVGHRRSPLARVARRVGVPDGDSVLLGASTGFRLSSLAAIAALLLLTVLVSAWNPTRALGTYLVVSPLVPLVGVAAGFGPHVDPTFELALATPQSGLRSALVRSALALVVSLPIVTGVGVLLEPWWVGPLVAVPGFAFVVATLAVSTWRPPLQAAAVVGTAWFAVATLALAAGDPLVLLDTVAMLCFAGLLVSGTLAIAVRRDRFSAPTFTV